MEKKNGDGEDKRKISIQWWNVEMISSGHTVWAQNFLTGRN